MAILNIYDRTVPSEKQALQRTLVVVTNDHNHKPPDLLESKLLPEEFRTGAVCKLQNRAAICQAINFDRVSLYSWEVRAQFKLIDTAPPE